MGEDSTGRGNGRSEAEAADACRELIRERKFADAVYQLTVELRNHPGSQMLADLRREASAEWEDIKRLESLDRHMAEIRKALMRGDPREAEALLESYRNQFGNDAGYGALVQEAARKKRLAEVAEGHLRAIQSAEDAGDWDAALAACKTAAEALPDDPQFHRYELRLIELRRQAEYARRDAEVRWAVAERDWLGADVLIAEFVRDFPGSESIGTLRGVLAEGRRVAEAEQASDEAAIAIGRQDWKSAEESLRRAEGLRPGLPRIGELAAQVRAGRQREQEAEVARQAVSDGLRQAKNYTGKEQYGDALTLLQKLARTHGTIPEVERAIQEVEAAIRRQKECAALEARVREAVRVEDWREAERRVEEMSRDYPERVLEARGVLASGRRRFADTAVAAAEKAVGSEDWNAAEKYLAAASTAGGETPQSADVRARMERGRDRQRRLLDARRALEAGEFDAADALLAPIRGDGAANALMAEAALRKEAARVKNAERNALGAEVAQAIRQADWGKAAAGVERLAGRFPNQAEEARRALEGARQKWLAEAVEGVEGAIRGSDWSGAERLLGEAARGGIDEARTTRLRERIAQGRQTDEAIGLAQRALDAGRFDEVERLVAPAGRDPRAAALTEEAKRAIAQREERDQAIRHVASLAAQERHAEALQFLEEVAKTYGGDVEISRIRRRVEDARDLAANARARAERAREAVAAGLERIGWHTREGDFDGAMEAASALIQQHGPLPELEQAKRDALAGKKRAAEFRELAALVKDACSRGDWKLAGEVAAELRQKFPVESGAFVAALETERARFIEGRLRLAETAIQQRNWKAAEELLLQSLAGRAETEAQEKLRARLREGKQAEAAIAKGTLEASELAEKGQYADALAKLDALQREGKGDEVARVRKEIERARAATEDAAAKAEQAIRLLAESVKNAGSLVDCGDFDAALEAVKALIARHGKSPELAALERRALAAKAKAVEAVQLEGRIAEAGRREEWPEAARLLEELSRRFPERQGEARRGLEAARSKWVAERLKSAAAAISERRWDEAEKNLAQSLTAEADGTAQAELRRKLAEGRKREQEAIRKGIAEADAQASERRYAEALEKLQAVTREFGPNAAVDARRLDIEADRRAAESEAQTARRLFAAGLKKAAELADAEAFDAALALLDTLSAVTGEAGELDEAKQRVRSAKARADAASKLAAQVREACRLADWKSAERVTSELKQRFPAQAEAVVRELEAERAKWSAAALEKAESAAKSGDWGSAERMLEDSLATGKESARHGEIRKACQKGRKQAESLAAARRAIQAKDLGKASALLSECVQDADVKALAAEISRQQAEAVEGTVAQARKLAEAGRFDEALKALTGSGSALEAARKEIAGRRDRLASVAKLATETRTAIAAKDWKHAAQLVESAEQLQGGTKLRRELEAARQASAEVSIAAAQGALAARKLAEAAQHVAEARVAVPQSAALDALHAAIEKAKAREKALKSARTAIEKQHFADAVKTLSRMLADDAGDGEVKVLLAEAQRLSAAAEAARAIEEGTKKAAGLAKNRQWEPAAAMLEGMLKQYGSNAQVERQLADVRKAMTPGPAAAKVAAPVVEKARVEKVRKEVPGGAWIAAACVLALVGGITWRNFGGSGEPPDDPKKAAAIEPVKKEEGKKEETKKEEGTKGPTKEEPLTPGRIAVLIRESIEKGDYGGAWARYQKLTATERSNPAIQEEFKKLEAHKKNQDRSKQALDLFNAGAYEQAEALAQIVLTTEFKVDGQGVLKSVNEKRRDLVAALELQLRNKDWQGARAALADLRKAFPTDQRLPGFEARVKELEPPKAPTCPPAIVAVAPLVEGYSGDPTRDLWWAGEGLGPGCALVLQGTGASFGKFTSVLKRVPRVPSSVRLVRPAANVIEIEQPTADNEYRIILRNKSLAPVPEIRLEWKRK